MGKTTYYGLNKPDVGDFYDVDVVNENSDILDRALRDNATSIGSVSDALSAEITNRETAIGEVATEVGNVKQDIANQVLIFSDVSVAVESWVEDATYTDYPYRADVACEGVTADHKPEVTFDVPEAISGNYAPVALTGVGVVSIYASEIPADAIVIPTIACVKAVGA